MKHIGKAILLVTVLLPLCGYAQQTTPKRVLVLYWYNKDFPGNALFDRAFQAEMQAKGRNVEYYPEYLESNRFPSEEQAVAFRDYLKRKYADREIDVVAAITDQSLDFLQKYRSDLFPNSPVVFVGAKRPPAEQLSAGAGMTGILAANTYKQTMDLALGLHPDARQLFVISGTLEHDKRFESIARQSLQGYADKLKITYLTDLSLEELISRTRSLPPHSIILYVWQQSLSPQQQLLETWLTLSTFASTASAPIYGMGSVNVGYGIVGGYVSSSEANGVKVSEMVLRILNGERAQNIGVEQAPAVYMFDWRQLQRWGIDESSLPAGSIVQFRQFTFWERNKWRIIAVVTLFVLQSIFITGLLVQRRGRQRAKEALDRLNAELEQRIAARTAALNNKSRELETFAYSVAHDLKAPLRGIDGYTRLLIEDHAQGLNKEGQEFLQTIQSSSKEMSQLIDDLLAYSRLERRELKTERFELQPLVERVVEQKRREETERDINFVVKVNGGSVVADPNGLTQSLKNYLDNAVKFTRNVANPVIEIGASDTPKNCVLWVQDNGIGFDMKYHDQIFDIFQRLNPTDEYPGTGVGLAIVRKAMERMGGMAWAESKPGRGASFFLEIPK
jgi:signal transduction histidine kinase